MEKGQDKRLELEDLLFCIDLQLFAKPEDEGRTEEPTLYKLRKAREEGKVVRSQELVSSVVLLSVFASMWIMSDYIIDNVKNIFTSTYVNLTKPINQSNLEGYVYSFVEMFFLTTGPFFLISVVMAFLSNVVQVGFQFAPKSMKVDFKKVSFTANKMFSRIFFSSQTFTNLIKSIMKVGVVTLVAYLIVSWQKEAILNTINMDVGNAFKILSNMIFYIAFISCIIFLILSVPDYFFQKSEHYKSLKMTRHELKEERKDTEGDPQIKQRLRERQREIMSQRMMEEVPKADVVITNPTHYAIAIKYEEAEMDVPLVIAKGQGYMALRIKEIAKENDVHMVEDKALAQSLYEIVEVGDEIPVEFYQAVAEVLAYVIRSREKVGV